MCKQIVLLTECLFLYNNLVIKFFRLFPLTTEMLMKNRIKYTVLLLLNYSLLSSYL